MAFGGSLILPGGNRVDSALGNGGATGGGAFGPGGDLVGSAFGDGGAIGGGPFGGGLLTLSLPKKLLKSSSLTGVDLPSPWFGNIPDPCKKSINFSALSSTVSLIDFSSAYANSYTSALSFAIFSISYRNS